MISPPVVGAPHRMARAGAAAGVALAAAAAGHAVAGGSMLSAAGLLAAAGVLGPPAWWLTGRERGWALLMGALVAGQLAAHAVFTATAAHGGGQAAELGHAHYESAWLPADLMLLGHLLAAAVAAGWLRRGERRAWAIARRAAATLDRTLAVLLGRPAPVAPGLGELRWDITTAYRPDQPALLRNIIILRGPPLSA